MQATSTIPSPTELSLLKAMWRQAPLTARELHARVEDELGWSFSSTRKTLERMLDKGMVAQASQDGIQVYRPLLEKVGTLAAFARDFSVRVMEMEAPLSVAMFTGSKLVDQQELERLDNLLQDWPGDEA
ncbi:BlaI/MecI/CopY family transcriptional regulator [Massilia sp. YIM B02443]|uniref:BlaI/MecI/CopY family transcriptional regulator n=1 Tax=Massilia sp. YIM B02443 TaxID=3050127 RepID=UPI0025B6F5EB|nr:BlaI/MecI/CopY family transcriptional regulator [Massilia sp. YIM B02443]MDN4037512.1 BlaI/MecI/CopY family transcriptional regulator [Massilia sp. YIM B02443]